MALSKNDLKNIGDLISVTFDQNPNLVTKRDIAFLPTKDDFYEKMDEVMGELKTIREEQDVLSGLNSKVNQLEERTLEIEDKLGIQFG